MEQRHCKKCHEHRRQIRSLQRALELAKERYAAEYGRRLRVEAEMKVERVVPAGGVAVELKR